MTYTAKCAKCNRTCKAVNLDTFEKPDWNTLWISGRSEKCRAGGLHDIDWISFL